MHSRWSLRYSDCISYVTAYVFREFAETALICWEAKSGCVCGAGVFSPEWRRGLDFRRRPWTQTWAWRTCVPFRGVGTLAQEDPSQKVDPWDAPTHVREDPSQDDCLHRAATSTGVPEGPPQKVDPWDARTHVREDPSQGDCLHRAPTSTGVPEAARRLRDHPRGRVLLPHDGVLHENPRQPKTCAGLPQNGKGRGLESLVVDVLGWGA